MTGVGEGDGDGEGEGDGDACGCGSPTWARPLNKGKAKEISHKRAQKAQIVNSELLLTAVYEAAVRVQRARFFL